MPNTIQSSMLKYFSEIDEPEILLESDLKNDVIEDKIEIHESVIIESGIELNNAKITLINKFLSFLQKNLNFKIFPIIHLLQNKKEGMTYGAYDPSNDIIYTLIKDRGIADALRTLAHEITHYKQKIENRIPKDLKGRNLDLESEANTKAGDLIYMFGLEHKEIYNGNF